jgi:hypothetical protein
VRGNFQKAGDGGFFRLIGCGFSTTNTVWNYRWLRVRRRVDDWMRVNPGLF